MLRTLHALSCVILRTTLTVLLPFSFSRLNKLKEIKSLLGTMYLVSGKTGTQSLFFLIPEPDSMAIREEDLQS